MENSTAEVEWIRLPGWGLNYGLAGRVELREIEDDIIREKVLLETLHDEVVGDAPEGVLSVKEPDVGSPVLLPCILHYFFHCQIMFNASVDAWQECLLHSGINELIADEEGCESGVEKQMKCFADAAAEGDHSEIGRVAGVTLFMDQLYY